MKKLDHPGALELPRWWHRSQWKPWFHSCLLPEWGVSQQVSEFRKWHLEASSSCTRRLRRGLNTWEFDEKLWILAPHHLCNFREDFDQPKDFGVPDFGTPNLGTKRKISRISQLGPIRCRTSGTSTWSWKCVPVACRRMTFLSAALFWFGHEKPML